MNTDILRQWTEWAWKRLCAAWSFHRRIVLSGLAAVVAALGVVIFISCYPAGLRRGQRIEGAPVVRARLAEGSDTLRIAANSTATWMVHETGRELLTGSGPWKVKAWAGGIKVDDRSVFGSSVLLSGGADGFTLGDTPYRGELLVTRRESGLTAVNIVGIEQYLRGVVPSEMPASWPQDALAAQAVAARTFVLHRIRENSGKIWNLKALDLAYKGRKNEHPASRRAVQETIGQVLTHSEQPFKAYFHSTCGGHTAPAGKVFGDTDIPPMQGVECSWCRDSSYYSWEARMDAAELASKLPAVQADRVRSIEPTDREPDGHARSIVVNGHEMNANRFRLAVGAQKLRSTNFTVEKHKNTFEFTGHGWGHGVGMCQWGAYGLAQHELGWRNILEYYYPGAPVREVY